MKRNKHSRTVEWSAILVLLSALNSLAQQPSTDDQVVKILEKNCAECHLDSDDGGFNYITDLQELIEKKKVQPGEPEKSKLWIRLTSPNDPMPPEGHEPRPSAEDLEVITNWIRLLETVPEPESEILKQPEVTPSDSLPRGTVSNSQVIQAVHAWISNVQVEDRRYKRFLILNHLHNLPTREENRAIGQDDIDLEFVRAAVSKTVNSLSWVAKITVPQMIDAERTIMAIDLRDIEWDANARLGRPDRWNILVQEYPYGLKHDQFPDDEATQRKAIEIYEMSRSDIPWIRADWFVAVGLQPQNYHILLYDAVFENVRRLEPKDGAHFDQKPRLEQPMTTEQLFQWLRVDVVGNLRRQRAARAGFVRSGVSSQPRLLEWHPALYGSLWNSYDFKPGSETMNLLARPLGPDGIFDPAKFANQSFQHDGGEFIYGLPNGLHGYLLSDASGNRINFGPSDVVEDRNRILGNSIIFNGVSCIACHKQGLITDFRDEVRYGIEGLPVEARRLVRKIYLDRPDLDEIINRDQARYRAAAMEAMLPFFSDAQQQLILKGGDLVEPVGPVTKRFLRDTLNLDLIAFELGVDREKLLAAIEHNERLQQLGLAGLANGATINRDIWESGAGITVYQAVAQALKIGTPASVQARSWRGEDR